VRPRRRTTSAGLVCALLSPRELPCECFQPPASLGGALSAASSRGVSRVASRSGSPRVSFSSDAAVPAAHAPAGAAEDSGPPGLIGCAAELYAAVAAATAEQALYAEASGPQEGLDDDAPFPSVLEPDSPQAAGIGGAFGMNAAAAAAAMSRAASRGATPAPSPRAQCAAAIEEASEWLDGLAMQPFVETVCAARAEASADDAIPGDCANAAVPAMLLEWRKLGTAALSAPPAELLKDLIGWRDPFVFADTALPPPGGGPPARVWRMLLGVGLKRRGGAALVRE
jgi:hypothetical protein